MKLWITTALIAMITISTYPQAAKAMTGNELLEYCEGSNYGQGACGGFILGVFDGYRLGIHTGGGKELVCDPGGVTTSQLEHIVLTYLKGHPGSLHREAVYLMLSAFKKAFPCD